MKRDFIKACIYATATLAYMGLWLYVLYPILIKHFGA